MQESTGSFDLLAAPMHIAGVRLKVRDLNGVAQFYQRVIGLTPIEATDSSVTLGVSGTPLLVLEGDGSLAPLDSRQAGLFHTAFLLPERADLARWLAFAAQHRIPLQGASDHIVSEAIYLSDPEGNGIEIYADRPPAAWQAPEGGIRMSTDPLDVQGLLREANGSAWQGFPRGGLVGHVHLQVGDLAAAEHFYTGILGFDLMLDYPGAKFFGSGGYHHQLAGNVWHSRNAGRRPENMAGLAEVTVKLRDGSSLEAVRQRAAEAGIAAEPRPDGAAFRDPWGTAIALIV